MKIKILIILVLLFSFRLYSIDIKLIDNQFQSNYFIDLATFNDNVAVVGEYKYLAGYFVEVQVFKYDSSWTKLPIKFFNGKDSTSLLFSVISNIQFDSLGTIWLSGYSLYNYRNNEWKEYFVDDSLRTNRRYERFLVDRNNNIWVTTIINDKENGYQFAELLKFDGKKFQLVWKSDYLFSFLTGSSKFGCKSNQTIAALADGRIVIYRNLSTRYPDYDRNNPVDVLFFNPDGSYEAEVLLTPSGTKFNGYDKRVSDIYPETSDKIWFALKKRSYEENGYSKTCCSGISLYENGTWTTFNESNGLFKESENTYKQICKIIKFKENGYLLIDKKHIYYMDSEYQLIPLSWDEILNNSEFIVCHSYYYGEKGIEYISQLSEKDTSNYLNSLSFSQDIIMPNGDIWLLTGKGILKFNPNLISGIAVKEEDKFGIIYPNPASNILSVSSDIEIKEYIIYDIYGRAVIKAITTESSINIDTLTAGTYFIRITSTNNTYYLKSFIKF